MTHTARAELTNVVRRRYCAAAGAEKRRVLDEFIAVTGYQQVGDSSAERRADRQEAADPRPTLAV
jgi:hypothetical protein